MKIQFQPTYYLLASRSTSHQYSFLFLAAGLLGSLGFLALTTWLQLSVRTSLILVSVCNYILVLYLQAMESGIYTNVLFLSRLFLD